MDGLLVIDKPIGPTSHDIVARARRALRETRIGHTGTLDPAASGVLPLVVGKATRLARFLSASDKSYDAVVKLGFATDTGDAQGVPAGPAYGGALPGADAIDAALDAFRGRFFQQPPAYSAKKIDGRRSYQLARAREAAPGPQPPPVQPSPAEVSTSSLAILDIDGDCVRLRLTCSAGFYVRALAHDLGERLGVGAHLAALRRTRSGDYDLSQALPIDVVERDHDAAMAGLLPLKAMLPHLPAVVLTRDGVTHARQGRRLGAEDLDPGDLSETTENMTTASRTEAAPPPGSRDEWVRLFALDGELVGLALPAGDSGVPPRFLHPSVVLI